MNRLFAVLIVALAASGLSAQAVATVQVTSAYSPTRQMPLSGSGTGAIWGPVWEVANGTTVADMGFVIDVDATNQVDVSLLSQAGPLPSGGVASEWGGFGVFQTPLQLTPTTGTFVNDRIYQIMVTASPIVVGQSYTPCNWLGAVVVGSPNNTSVITLNITAGGQAVTGPLDVPVGSTVASLGLSLWAENSLYTAMVVDTTISNVGTTGLNAAEFTGANHTTVQRPQGQPGGVFDTVGSHEFRCLFICGNNMGTGLCCRAVSITVNVTPDPRVVVTDSVGAVSHGDTAAGDRDFGSHDLLQLPTGWVSIQIANNGNGDLTLGGWSLGTPATGRGGGAFGFDAGAYQTTIPQGGSTVLAIRFEGGSIGTSSVWIDIPHNDATTPSPFRFEIKGTATAVATVGVTGPAGAVAPGATHGFGNIDVAQMPTAFALFHVANHGSAPLQLGTPVLSGADAQDFVLSLSGFSSSVAPGQQCSFGVAFHAALIGAKQAVVTFTHNDAQVASPFSVQLDGLCVSSTQPVIATTSLPTGTQNFAYGPFDLAAVGGVAPYTFVLESGMLPAGMSLDSAGTLTGTPTAWGLFAFTVKVRDNLGSETTAALTLDVQFDPRNAVAGLDGTGTGGGGCASAPAGGLVAAWLVPLLWTARRRRVG